MNKTKVILLAALLISFTTFSKAQTLTCWRIVNGPGAGVVVTGSGGFNVFDSYYEADGFVAFGSFPDCPCTGHDGHYHGILFDQDDPNPKHCGWGCVDEVPCTPAEAADALHDAIDYIGNNIDPDFAGKLDDIFHDMESAATVGCYSVVDALAGAFGEEMRAYFLDYGYTNSFRPLERGLVEYVDSTLDGLTYSNFWAPTIPEHKVSILQRIGTGMRSRLIDPGTKINAGLGQVISLEGLGASTLMMPQYRWAYRFKGAGTGDLPDGMAAAFLRNRITVMSLKPTSVMLNLSVEYPDKRIAKDALMLTFK